jgi:hypothetical protein
MRITKRQLRKIIKEACALASEEPINTLSEPAADPNIPVPEDYDAARYLLEQNPELVDMGIDIVMQTAGTSCERSTVQAIIDHLQDLLHGEEGLDVVSLDDLGDEFSFTGDVGELPGEEAFGIGYEAGKRDL